MYPTDDGESMNDTSRRRQRPLPSVGSIEPSQRHEGDEQGNDGWFVPPSSSSYYPSQGIDPYAYDYAPAAPRSVDNAYTGAASDHQHLQWAGEAPNPDMMMEPPSHRRLPATSFPYNPHTSTTVLPWDAPPRRVSNYHDKRDTSGLAANYSYYGAHHWGIDYDGQRKIRHMDPGYDAGNETVSNSMFQHHMHHPQAMEFGPTNPMYFPFGAVAPRASTSQMPYSGPFHPGSYAGQEVPRLDMSLDLKRRTTKTFPEKFMKAVLENPNEDALAWLPDGRSFVIVNPNLFTSEVLEKTFKKAKYASFIRKLHRWGFVRLTSGTGTDCFYHPLFTLIDPDQATNILCTPPQDRISKEAEDSQKPSLAGVERFVRAKLAAASAKEKAERENLPQPREAERVVTQQPDDISSLSHEKDPVQIREVPFGPKQVQEDHQEERPLQCTDQTIS